MLIGFVRNRTSTIVVMYSLYLYFLGLSLRNTSKALDIFEEEKQSHIVLYGIGYKDLVHAIFLQQKEKSFSIYYRDETVIQIGDHHYWLWICIEPIHKSVLGINISQKKETCL